MGRMSNLWHLLVLQVESRLAVKQMLLQIHCCCGAAQPLQSSSESFGSVLALRTQRFCFLRAVCSALGSRAYHQEGSSTLQVKLAASALNSRSLCSPHSAIQVCSPSSRSYSLLSKDSGKLEYKGETRKSDFWYTWFLSVS